MTEDEKYVREHWQDVYDSGYSVRFCVAEMAYEKFPYFAGVIHRWAAAAEFTRTRLQQIRDVEQEIRRIVAVLNATDVSLRYEMIPWGDDEDDTTHINDIVDYVRDICAESRILAREQAALADLKRGLRVAEERTERCQIGF